MKTHKIKRGDGEEFITYCGLTHDRPEPSDIGLVASYTDCTCKKCMKSYTKELKK